MTMMRRRARKLVLRRSSGRSGGMCKVVWYGGGSKEVAMVETEQVQMMKADDMKWTSIRRAIKRRTGYVRQ